MHNVSGLVPARFLTLTAHLIIVIMILLSRDENIKSCLPLKFTQDEYTAKDTQLVIGLSVSLGLFALELIGFFGGVSMFMPFQSLLSITAHTSASVTLAYFMFEEWPCDWYWWVFSFCNVLPALTELITIIGVVFFRKGL